MELSEFLNNWHREFGRCGGVLIRAECDPASRLVAIEFDLHYPRRPTGPLFESRAVRVEPREVEDWAIRPCHNLLEGTTEIEFVTQDPLLTREHLQSLDCEGCRTEWPERVVMLRHGQTYVVAEGFDVRWVQTEGKAKDPSVR